MKRLCRIALALALCAALAAGALAEPTMLAEFEDVRWIDGTNLMSMEGRDGYCIAQLDGTPVTGEEFSRSFSYNSGLIVTSAAEPESVNCSGAVNLEGAEVIPFQYGDIKVLNEYWALAFTFAPATADHYDYESWSSDNYYLIDTVDVYNLEKGSKVGSLPRANYEEHYANGRTINIKDRSSGAITAYDADFNALGTDLNSVYDDEYAQMEISTFRSNGQQGLMDGEGNIIMEPKFQYINSFYGNYAEVSTGETYGLIDASGNVIIPAEYENINTGYYGAGGGSQYENFGYFCVEKDGKLGYVRAGGEVSCEPKYAADALENNGASATYTDIEGKLHILAGDGVETVIEGYDQVRPFSYGSGVFYRVNDADYNYGMIDFHGNVVFPCEYESISLSGDGRYALVNPDYDESELYELDYSAVAGAAEPGEAPALIAPEAESPAAAEPEEAPAEPEEAPAEPEEEPASGEVSAVAGLVDSAILLLQADAGANGSAVTSLLNAAIAQIGADSPAGSMLSSVITLLDADAGANGAAAVTLLENAKPLL